MDPSWQRNPCQVGFLRAETFFHAGKKRGTPRFSAELKKTQGAFLRVFLRQSWRGFPVKTCGSCFGPKVILYIHPDNYLRFGVIGMFLLGPNTLSDCVRMSKVN